MRQLDKAEKREGSVIFVAGEAGVGKTRLAREFVKVAKARGATCLYSQCSSARTLLPYSAWIGCVRQFASEATVQSFFEICGDVSGQMLRLLPELTALAGGDVAATAATEDQQSVFELPGRTGVRYFEALAQFFFRLSNTGTLSVILDDFQWCDQSSLDLLQHVVATGLGNHSIMILCLYRDTHLEALNPALLHATAAMLGGQGPNKTLELARLDRAAVASLLRGSLNETEFTEEFCNLLYRKAGGNPLFMRETLALLKDQGLLSSERKGNPLPSEVSELQVPNTVKDIIRQRLLMVDPEVVEALRVAALVGESFSLGILQRAASIRDDEHLLDLLEAALASGLVREQPTPERRSTFVFADEILVEVLAEKFSQERLRRYHLRIAQIMEEEAGNDKDEQAAELAEHFRLGGVQDKAFEYSLRAGDAAARVNAYKEAGAHYEKALASLEHLRDQSRELTRGIVLEKLGDTMYVVGDTAKAYRHWEESATLYEALGDSERAGPLRRKLGWYYSIHLCDRDKAMAAYGMAMRHYSNLPTGRGVATLYHHLGEHYLLAKEFELARENWQKAIDIAREFDVLDVEVTSSIMLAHVTPVDEKEKILRCLHKSELLTADRVYSLGRDSFEFAACHAQTHTGIALVKLTGDSVAARDYFLLGLQTAERLGRKPYEIWTRTWLAAYVYVPLGELAKAKQLLADAALWAPLEHYRSVRTGVFEVLGAISLLEGDLEKAEEELRVARELDSKSGDYSIPGSGLRATLRLGQLYTLRGDFRQAERYLREAHKTLRGDSSRVVCYACYFAECLSLMIQLYAKEGNREEAASYLVLLQDFASFADTVWASGYASLAMGLVAILEGSIAKAIPALEEAVECWKQLGWPFQLGATYRALASARMENGEIEVASDLLTESLRIFEQAGARRDAREILVAQADLKKESSSQVFRLSKEGSEKTKQVFECLVQAFIGDYFTRRLSPNSSGWRSMGEISRSTRIPIKTLYMKNGKKAEGLRELLQLGLAETREFTHQRGRGGTVTRARISFDNEEVKQYVARRSKGGRLVMAQSVDRTLTQTSGGSKYSETFPDTIRRTA